MKSIKAKIVYYNIIKPTYDLIELFSINPGKSIKRSVFNSVSNSVWNSVRKSIRDNIK